VGRSAIDSVMRAGPEGGLKRLSLFLPGGIGEGSVSRTTGAHRSRDLKPSNILGIATRASRSGWTSHRQTGRNDTSGDIHAGPPRSKGLMTPELREPGTIAAAKHERHANGRVLAGRGVLYKLLDRGVGPPGEATRGNGVGPTAKRVNHRRAPD